MKQYKIWSAIWFIFSIFFAISDNDILAAAAFVNSTIWVAIGTLREDIK